MAVNPKLLALFKSKPELAQQFTGGQTVPPTEQTEQQPISILPKPLTSPSLQERLAGTVPTKSVTEAAGKELGEERGEAGQIKRTQFEQQQAAQEALLGAPGAYVTGGKVGDVTIGVPKTGEQLQQEVKEKIDPAYATKVWDRKAAADIAMSSLSPKIEYLMEVGGRGYNELKNQAKNIGIDLNFEKGGFEAWKATLTKKGLNAAQLLPVMDAADKVRPEVGFEVMRQIGPFRSAHAGMVFTETLPDFSGHVPKDIARAVTTMTKSFAGALSNNQLAQEVFNKNLTRDEQRQMVKQYEANMIRGLNRTYRQMGIMDNFHGVGLSMEQVAKNSKFTDTETQVINDFQNKYPDRKREDIIVTLIDEGLL